MVLPTELYQHIVFYVKDDLKTLAALCQVSREFYNLAVPHIYKEVTLIHGSSELHVRKNSRIILKSLLVCRKPALLKHVQTVRITCSTSGGTFPHTHNSTLLIFDLLKNLISKVKFVNLKRLYVTRQVQGCDCICNFLSNNSSYFQELTMQDKSMHALQSSNYSKLPPLSYLNIQESYSRPGVIDSALEHQIHVRDNFTYHNMINGNNYNMNLDQFVYKVDTLLTCSINPTLDMLAYLGVTNLSLTAQPLSIPDSWFMALVKHVPNIKYLNLSGVSQELTPSVFRKVSRHLVHLQDFKFLWYKSYTEGTSIIHAVMMYLLPQAKSLKSLEIGELNDYKNMLGLRPSIPHSYGFANLPTTTTTTRSIIVSSSCNNEYDSLLKLSLWVRISLSELIEFSKLFPMLQHLLFICTNDKCVDFDEACRKIKESHPDLKTIEAYGESKTYIINSHDDNHKQPHQHYEQLAHSHDGYINLLEHYISAIYG